MKRSEVKIKDRFICGGREWQVSDIGTRTVVAILVKEGWMNGPPYALPENVFDENDLPGCDLVKKGSE
jgi:hypothetical protein